VTEATSISRGRLERLGLSDGVMAKSAIALIGLAAVAFIPGCGKGSGAAAADAQTQVPERLPEDPILGAKSTAEWQAHLVAEERERKLHYDRDRMADHRAVVRFLTGTRARYERAASKTAVMAIQARLPPAIDGVRRRIKRIDHWGGSSNLLADYDFLLNTLAGGYPLQSRAEFDRRLKFIEDWLAEASESEDE
jgi:hypothetical protein